MVPYINKKMNSLLVSLHPCRVKRMFKVASILTKKFDNFETGRNGTKINSWKRCQKIRKLLNFPKKTNHSDENSGNSDKKVKWNGKIPSTKFPKIWVYLTRLPPFPEIPGNAVLFVTRNFQKLKFVKHPDIQAEDSIPMT